MTSAHQDRSRCARWLLLCVSLALAVPAWARPARRPVSSRAAHHSLAAQALQARRLERGLASLARLKADRRRRRYRDGWEAVARELDSAVRADPSGPRAAEAALAAARVREELWNISRGRTDARAAVAAYRSVDERYPGAEPSARALASGVRLAVRTRDARGAAALGQRLARYARTPESSEALALVRPARRARPEVRAEPSPGLRAAGKADRKAQLPVDDDDSDGEAAPAAEASAPPAAAPLVRRADRAAPDAPPSPAREAETDVPAEAGHILDELVQASRGAAEGAAATSAQALAEARSEPARDAGAAAAPPDRDEASMDAPAEPPPPDARKARQLRAAALADRTPSVAEQLGLKVRKVVIDPGHGGRDTGAIGPHGLREKAVALSIARKLAAKLRAQGLTVVLTRDRDVFVSLDERTRIANEAHADLFLSIHCNAARRRKLEGVETWTLNVASDRYAARLASFENAEDERRVSDLRLILADLATKVNAGDARELAQSVQGSLVRTLRARVGPVRDNGVKQALFYVLLGTHMPSILVETAFLSNPREEARLRSERYQDGTADAIARGVHDFLDGRRKLAMIP